MPYLHTFMIRTTLAEDIDVIRLLEEFEDWFSHIPILEIAVFGEVIQSGYTRQEVED